MIIKVKKGYTLVEILLVVALTALISGSGFGIYQGLVSRNDMVETVNVIISSSRKAQSKSTAMQLDSSWGVQITTGTVTVFKGASYAARDVNYDEISSMPTSTNPTGVTEFVFAKLTGIPSNTGNIVITGINNSSKTITINSKGILNY